MADIFLSYASADRERAKVLAEALATQGWSVWWDRTIPPGRQFDEVIEEELTAAGCVVVLWSRASVASSWVKTEASEAMERRVLVPALIEEVKIPLEFRRLQAADLSRWQPGRADAQLDEFFRAIAAQLDRGGRRGAGVAEPASGPSAAPVDPRPSARPARPARSRVVPAAAGAVAMAAALIVTYAAYSGTATRGTATRVPAAVRDTPERVAEPARPVRPEPERERGSSPPRVAERVEPRQAAPRPATTEPRPTYASRVEPPPRPAAAAPIDISGVWRDVTWGSTSRIAQDGDEFRFTVWGQACRGSFQSTGTGLIEGQRFASAYRSTIPSEGRCTGTVSADGTRIETRCLDSVCGAFASSAVRQ
jgi:hypothetical protein